MATINGPVGTKRHSRANRARSQTSAATRLRRQATAVKHTVREMGGTATKAAQEKLEDMRQTAAGYYAQGRGKVHMAQRTLEDYIREYPVKSILLAAGVGLLLGGFWIRRR